MKGRGRWREEGSEGKRVVVRRAVVRRVVEGGGEGRRVVVRRAATAEWLLFSSCPPPPPPPPGVPPEQAPLPHPGPRCVGACLLPQTQEQACSVRGGLVEGGVLAGGGGTQQVLAGSPTQQNRPH